MVRKPKFYCEDCGHPYRDDGTCLTIVNERRDEIKHYCPYCTVHGKFELNPGDELIYDKTRYRAERYGDPEIFAYLVRA